MLPRTAGSTDGVLSLSNYRTPIGMTSTTHGSASPGSGSWRLLRVGADRHPRPAVSPPVVNPHVLSLVIERGDLSPISSSARVQETARLFSRARSLSTLDRAAGLPPAGTGGKSWTCATRNSGIHRDQHAGCGRGRVWKSAVMGRGSLRQSRPTAAGVATIDGAEPEIHALFCVPLLGSARPENVGGFRAHDGCRPWHDLRLPTRRMPKVRLLIVLALCALPASGSGAGVGGGLPVRRLSQGCGAPAASRQ